MNAKRNRPVLIAICSSILLFSCSAEPIEKYSFAEKEVVIKEANDSFYLKTNMTCSSVKNNSYSFEKTMHHQDMVDCISKTEEIFAYVNETKNLNVCVFSKETYSDTYISDGTIVTYLQDWNSPEYVSSVLLGIFGESCNYGVIYGYSQFISSKLNKTNLKKEDIDFKNESNCSALDLNLLCFNDKYVSKEEVKTAKDISLQFVSDYIDANNEQTFKNILKASGNIDTSKEFSNALARYYYKNNIEYTPTNILYSYGGSSYEYIAKSQYANFYLEKNWRDENQSLNPLVTQNFLHENYSDIKTFFETNVNQMSQYQTLFEFDSYNNNLSVIFSNSKIKSASSYYEDKSHTIHLMNVDSLMHEYIHSLTIDKYSVQSSWSVEGLARYFSYKYDYYGISMLNVDYNQATNEFIKEYKRRINRDIDMAIDFNELENIMVYCRKYNDPNTNYLAGSSFVGYLISKFGEQELIKMVFSKEGIQGGQYSSLVTEWNSFVENTYSDYAKYRN